MQGLRDFMDKVSNDITKSQTYTAAQENTGKLIENMISQALIKPQDVTPPNPTIDLRTFRTNHISNSSFETNWTFGMPQQSNNDVYHSQRPYETPTFPHVFVNQQPSNQTPFDFNQSVVELFRCQTKLTLNTQWVHQQTIDALNNIAKSSFQANKYFLNDIPNFKAKDP